MYQDRNRKLTALDMQMSRRRVVLAGVGGGVTALLAAAGARPDVAVAAPTQQVETPHGEPVVKLSEAPFNTLVIPRSASGESWSLAASVAIPDFPATRVIDGAGLHQFAIDGPGAHVGFNLVLNPGQQRHIGKEGDYTTIKFDNLPENSQVVAMDSTNQRQVVVANGQERWAAFGVADSPTDLPINFRVIRNAPGRIDVSLVPFNAADIQNPKFPVIKNLTGAFPAPAVEAPAAAPAPLPAAQAPAAPAPVEGPRGLVTLRRLRFEEATPGEEYFFAKDGKGNEFNYSAVYRIPYLDQGTRVMSAPEGPGIIKFITDQRARSIATDMITNPEFMHYNAMSNRKEVPGAVASAYVRTQRGARVSIVGVDGRPLKAAEAREGEVVIILPTRYAADLRIRAEIAHPSVSTEHTITQGPLDPSWRSQTVVLDANDGVVPQAQFNFQ